MASKRPTKPIKPKLLKPIGVTEIARVDTQYKERPEHRGHTVTVDGWSEDYVMLIITADSRSCEALIRPQDLIDLAEKAKADLHRW
jgi:hypothetical protein